MDPNTAAALARSFREIEAVIGRQAAQFEHMAVTGGAVAPTTVPLFGVPYTSSAGASEAGGGENKKKRKKRPVDPNAPKKPRSAYILFVKENQPIIKKTYPDAAPKELFSMIGMTWKKLEDSKRQQYLDASQGEKDQYAEAIARYRAAQATEQATKTEPATTSSEV